MQGAPVLSAFYTETMQANLRSIKMWIYRYTYCLIQQHAYVDITTLDRPYRYCLRCGKVKEPLAYLKKQEYCPVQVTTR